MKRAAWEKEAATRHRKMQRREMRMLARMKTLSRRDNLLGARLAQRAADEPGTGKYLIFAVCGIGPSRMAKLHLQAAGEE